MDCEKCECATCGDKASLICSGCRNVRYCSKEHQKAHWKEHQQTCKAYQEEWDIQIGKHLIASRALKPGDIILQEAPLIVGLETSVGESHPLCVGCCSTLNGGDRAGKKCPKCNWPMCGDLHCWEDGSPHSQGECSLLNAAGGHVTSQPASNEVYYSIMVLRCLSLRDRDMKKWKKLMELKDCKSAAETCGLDVVDVDAVVKLVKRLMPSSTISKETIVKLCNIFYVNSFALQPIYDHRSRGVRAVYHVGSMIEHHCVANSTHSFTKDGKIVVRAAVLIPKGSRITLNYCLVPLWSTIKRRLFLFERKFFRCYCDRCKDPTEFGTYVGGIYCTSCPNLEGVLLAEDPLNCDSDWVCNKCSFRKPMPNGNIALLLRDTGRDFVALNRNSVSDLEAFVHKYSTIHHPHHSYLNEAKKLLCNIYLDSNIEEHHIYIDEKLLDKKEALVRELLDIADVVTPGLTRERANLLHHLHSVMKTRIDNLKYTDYDISADELTIRIKETKKNLKELLTILSFEQEETQEGQLYKRLSIKAAQVELSLAILRS